MPKKSPATRALISERCRAHYQRCRKALSLLDSVERGLLTVTVNTGASDVVAGR